MPDVRIALVDGHSLFREAMTKVLQNEEGIEVVGARPDRHTAVDMVAAVKPDVVIVDHDLPPDGGVAAVRDIKIAAPEARILLLSDSEDGDLLARAFEAGVNGFLSKVSPLNNLVHATISLHAGDTIVPGKMLGPLIERLMGRHRARDELREKLSKLTKRENEVLQILADGASNEEIARALVISPETARTHIQNILAKLEVHSRLEASALVRRVISLDSNEASDGDLSQHSLS